MYLKRLEQHTCKTLTRYIRSRVISIPVYLCDATISWYLICNQMISDPSCIHNTSFQCNNCIFSVCLERFPSGGTCESISARLHCDARSKNCATVCVAITLLSASGECSAYCVYFSKCVWLLLAWLITRIIIMPSNTLTQPNLKIFRQNTDIVIAALANS